MHTYWWQASRRASMYVLGLATVVGGLQSVEVQAAGAAQRNASGAPTIEEVVVTARYREEELSKIGQSISAVPAEELQSSGIVDFVDLARQIPGLTFAYSGPGENTPIIRGLGSSSISGTEFVQTPQVVSIYFDDVTITTPTPFQRDIPLYDMARVEVLRGPQGTLYGEGSIGGTIRYISADPDLGRTFLNVGTTVSTIRGGGDSYDVDATVNVPLVENLWGIRATAFRRSDAGYIDLVPTGEDDVNDLDKYGGRVVVLGEPTDRLTLRFVAQAETSDRGGTSGISERRGLANLQNDVQPLQIRGKDDNLLLSGRVTYDFGPASITSITGYYTRDYDRRGWDQFIGQFFAPVSATGAPPMVVLNNKDEFFTEEIRIVSNIDGPFSYAGGLFFKRAKATSLSYSDFDVPPVNLTTRINYDGINEQTQEQYAIFGEGYYQLSPVFKLTGGLRYYIDDTSVFNDNEGGTLLFPVKSAPVIFDSKLTEILPKASLEAQVSDSTLLYLTAGRAARNGGQNAPNVVAELPPDQREAAKGWGPDFAWTYEAGIKARLFDNRISVDSAAFYTQWRDYQVQVIAPITQLPLITQNVGSAHSMGIEGSIRAQIIHSTSVFFSGSVVEAETDAAYLAGGRANVTVPAGTPLPVSKWAYSTGIDTDIPLGPDMLLTGRVNYTRTDGRPANLFNPLTTPDYGLWNVRLGLEWGKWSVAAFVNNAENTLAIIGGNATQRIVTRPQVVGLTVRYTH